MSMYCIQYVLIKYIIINTIFIIINNIVVILSYMDSSILFIEQ